MSPLASVPDYSARRTSSVSYFRENERNGEDVQVGNHQSIGLGIRQSSKVDISDIKPITPPPNYSDSNEQAKSTNFSLEVKNQEALSPSDQEYWITAKDILALRQLPYLTGMRAIATLIIQLAHVTVAGTHYIDFFGYYSLSTHFIQGAFLVTGSLLILQSRQQQQQIQTNSSSKKHWILSIYDHVPNFFYARWVRLYPAMILCLGLNSIWWYYRHNQPLHLLKLVTKQFFKFSQYKLFFHVDNDDPPNPFANFWFLDVQEHFYIFWALCLPLIARMKPIGRFVIIASLFGFSFYRRLKEGTYNATLPLNLYKMVCGASIYLFPIPKWVVMQHARVAAIASLSITLIWGFSPTFTEEFTKDQHRLYGDNFAVITSVLLIYAAIAKGMQNADPAYQAERKAYFAQRLAEEVDLPWHSVYIRRLMDWDLLSILEMKWLEFIGRISYSWYLWQVPLLLYHYKFRLGFYEALPPTCEALTCALLSTFLMEEPIRNAYTAHVKRKRALATAAIKDKAILQDAHHHVSLQMPLQSVGKDTHQA